MIQTTQSRGRPREHRVDQALGLAVRAALTEQGYQRLTIEAVARRAGVGKAAIYRRYHSKAEMVFAALFSQHLGEAAYLDSGSLEGDLTAAIDVLYRLCIDPPVRAAVPGLLADLTGDPEHAPHLSTALIGGDVTAFSTVIARAVERGELDAGTDARLLYVTWVGAVFAWFFLAQWDPDPDLPQRITRLLIAATRGNGTDVSHRR